MIQNADKIIVALDTPTAAQAVALAQVLQGTGARFKVGMELFYAAGPAIVTDIKKFGAVFLDLKLHDIPQTMANTMAVIAQLGVWMTTVHAAAGAEALKAVIAAAAQAGAPEPLIVAVTVLTSLADLSHVGSSLSAQDNALALMKLARRQGLAGVVCSPREAAAIKAADANCLCVTPGIRRAEDPVGDQARSATPMQAIAGGSDYLVIGRPITQAPNPLSALQAIAASLSA
jgi:orotidine-5'-phosphate decarboxylase